MRLDIDPKVDYAFRKLFGSESNQDVLIDLLNAVLRPKPGRVVTDIELLTPFSDRDALDDKLAILDIRARDQGQRQFHVEMQMRMEFYFPGRALYYWAKFHQQQMREGDKYATLRPTVSIWFINEPVFPEVAGHHLQFRLWDTEHGVGLTEDLSIHIFQLPHFVKGVAELETAVDRWCWFLRHATTLDPDNLPGPLDVPPIRRALEVLKVFTQDERERERYEARLRAERDQRSFLFAADQRGEDRGLLLGRIQLCEALLGQPQTPRESLRALSPEELSSLAERLEAQVKGSRS